MVLSSSILARAADGLLPELDALPLAAAIRRRDVPLGAYRDLLVQFHSYVAPGPDLLRRAAARAGPADGDLRRYLTEHAAADAALAPLLRGDLQELGVGAGGLARTGPTRQTEALIAHVRTLYEDADTTFVLVSDAAVKLLLRRYGDDLIAGVWPKLPRPPRGVRFLSGVTLAEREREADLAGILDRTVTPANAGRFFEEFRTVLGLFRDVLGALP